MSYMNIPNYMKPLLSAYNMGQVFSPPSFLSAPMMAGSPYGSVGKWMVAPAVAGAVPAIAYKGLKGMTTGKRGKVWKPSTASNVDIGVSARQRANMRKVTTDMAINRSRANPQQVKALVRRNVYQQYPKKRKYKKYRKRRNYY
jgi:hypothetical protein